MTGHEGMAFIGIRPSSSSRDYVTDLLTRAQKARVSPPETSPRVVLLYHDLRVQY